MMLSIVIIITVVIFYCVYFYLNCAGNSISNLTRDKQCVGLCKYIWSEFAKPATTLTHIIVLQNCINK